MISENLKKINLKIKEICKKNNISQNDIMLLAVTKTHPLEKIEEALENGISYIAENKVQDAGNKIPFIKNSYKEFHFIGHLQSNKINKLLKINPTLIHSIDKISTAKKLNEQLQSLGRIQNILIQVNTSGEESKSGINPKNTIEFVKSISKFENLKIKGLMTIGMFTDDKKIIRNCFKDLRLLFNEIKDMEINNVDMKYLSMGMSNDFEIALEEGANIIRLGSIIFGAREYF
ncbi:MAG: YggS family pyridoxal phosphate-dependent enzyme [Candidatus Cloacimonetes bacterium]|nr:YggS family pyridoxal phosphate-dependent enzyme [Candidatus Cloacimonadota bacterium]